MVTVTVSFDTERKAQAAMRRLALNGWTGEGTQYRYDDVVTAERTGAQIRLHSGALSFERSLLDRAGMQANA